MITFTSTFDISRKELPTHAKNGKIIRKWFLNYYAFAYAFHNIINVQKVIHLILDKNAK